jgi:hypothetical protein
MDVTYREPLPDKPGHYLEYGWASWNERDGVSDHSVRFFVPQKGSLTKFDRYNSPEFPVGLLTRALEIAEEQGAGD